MAVVQLTLESLGIQDCTPKMLYGLKINQHVLDDKGVSIYEIIDMMGITTCTYVVGFDTKLSESAKPHYHIHWSDSRSLEALRKHKGRCMKAYGKDTKLYPAKKIEGSDFYVWYGYAVKEEFVVGSSDIDLDRLKVEAQVQAKIKKDKLKYEDKKEFKKAQQQSFEDKLYALMDEHYSGTTCYMQPELWWWADKMYSFALYNLERHLTRTPLEIYTWKYLLSRKIINTEVYVKTLISQNISLY